MKRLIFCFDGSWNRLDAPHPTNVLLTAENVLPMAGDGAAQVTFYDEGVGSEDGEALVGGMFGAGLVRNLGDGYRFLIFNYAPGDEIYVFGFSRGAYTARSFVGLLGICGILDRHAARRSDEAISLYKKRSAEPSYAAAMMRFRAQNSTRICVSEEEDRWRSLNIEGYEPGDAPLLKIKYLAVWDTVGALGIPRYMVMANAINRQHQFHDVRLSSMVDYARHAVAIDEQRVDFEPTLWDNLDQLNAARGAAPEDADAPYQQVWFPGGHGSVGGGGERRGLSDAALDWIWDGARLAGLDLDCSANSYLHRLAGSHREYLANRAVQAGFNAVSFVLNHLPRADRAPGPVHLHEVSAIARRRWKDTGEHLPEALVYRPVTLQGLAAALDGLPDLGDEPEIAGFSLYIVKRGDTLKSIAEAIYGDGMAAGMILAANANKLTDENGLHPGQALRLPELLPEVSET